MSKEVPLQFNMFTSELVDNRTPRQKRQATQRQLPQQIEMFSQREIAQFGVHARPKMSLPTSMTLALIIDDPRTPDEVERDQQRAAEVQTVQMFDEEPGATNSGI